MLNQHQCLRHIKATVSPSSVGTSDPSFSSSSPFTMRFSTIISGAALAVSVLASPIDNYIVHEKRHAAPFGWKAIGEVKRDGVLPMRIAIKQRNIDQGYNHIMDVSDPESPNFGKHWTPQQVAEMFAPRYVIVHFPTPKRTLEPVASSWSFVSRLSGLILFGVCIALRGSWHPHNTGLDIVRS